MSQSVSRWLFSDHLFTPPPPPPPPPRRTRWPDWPIARMFLMKWTLFCLAIIIVIVIPHNGERHFPKWIWPPSNQHFRRRTLIEFWCQLLSKTMKDFRLKYYPRFVTLSHNGIPDWINFSIKSDLPLGIRRTIELTEQPFLRAAASQPFAFCQTVEQPQSQSPSHGCYRRADST